MFIGHYGVAYGLKKADQSIPLSWLFVATQLNDIMWNVLVLLGVERVTIQPGALVMTPLVFDYYPYSHSLITTVLLAAAVAAVVYLRPAPALAVRLRTAAVMAVAVVSHYVLDLIVHVPDLPLAPGLGTKVGLGLWRYGLLSFLLEATVFLLGVWLYHQATRGKGFRGTYGTLIFAVVLVMVNAFNLVGPPPPSPTVVAAFGLVNYVVLTVIAQWLDKARVPRTLPAK